MKTTIIVLGVIILLYYLWRKFIIRETAKIAKARDAAYERERKAGDARDALVAQKLIDPESYPSSRRK